MAEILFCDFETRSELDLREVGLDVYARHASTQPWCLGYAFDDEPVDIIEDLEFTRPAVTRRVMDHVHGGGLVVAHNAPFELAIWNHICRKRFGWPSLATRQTRCTMAMAYAMALPGALDTLTRVLGSAHVKDQAGHRLMLQMAKPRRYEDGRAIWWDDRERRERLYDYCRKDVEAERWALANLVPLSKSEQVLWMVDQRINNRGVYVDQAAVKGALGVVDIEEKRLRRELVELTGGIVSSPTEVERLKTWIQSRGVALPSLAKADVLETLADGTVPDDVRHALTIRQEAAKTSTAKLDKMLHVPADGRMRHVLQYHAAGTGRWGGRRIQPQNIPRPTIDQVDIERILDVLAAKPPEHAAAFIRMMEGRPLDQLSNCLRGLIIAEPGNTLMAADFSAVEARGVAWLAGQQDVLDAFAAGADIYCQEASGIYRREITKKDKDERQVGKIGILAFGYGGGIGAGATFARAYRIDLLPLFNALKPTFTEDEKDTAERNYMLYKDRTPAPLEPKPAGVLDIIKQRWRAKNWAIVDYWKTLNHAAIGAVLEPGTTHRARDVRYKMRGSFLWCLLPSGRALCYPFPEVAWVDTPFKDDNGNTVQRPELSYMGMDDRTHAWSRQKTYGGKLAENVTQAICRDLLAEAILRVENAGFETVLHVHDEIVVELCEAEGPQRLKEFEELCAVTPDWAAGMPMAAEAWCGKRYRK